MAREYTYVDEAALAAGGFGGSPELIANQLDLQQAAFQENPASAEAAQTSATAAQTSADSANASASAAQTSADNAQTRADSAYTLAGTKVTRDNGPVFSAPAASPTRTPLPAYTGGTAGAVYTQADVQALMDQVAALTSRLAAVIVDGRANGVFRAS